MGVERSDRLMSLDALRGFDMFWILYPSYPIFHALLVALGLKGCWIDMQMDHPEWIGFTFYDTIYPLFLFMAGVSWPYSLASSRAKGVSTLAISLRVLRRAVVLFVLGMVVHGFLQNGFCGRISSVLGSIGIAWGAAAFLFMAFGWRARLATCAAVLVAYGAIPFLVSPPGADSPLLPYADKASCLYAWIDASLMPKPQIAGGVANHFPMVVTALMGMFAGEWLRRESPGLDRRRKAAGLAAAAAVCVAAGLVAAFCLGRWSVPLVKSVWSSSYALVTGGYSFAMLALFYWMIDVRGWTKWSFPFRVIGMNAIFAYMASRSIFPWRVEMDVLFGGVMRCMPTPEWGAFAGQLGYVVVYWLLLYCMYRRQIFLKA